MLHQVRGKIGLGVLVYWSIKRKEVPMPQQHKGSRTQVTTRIPSALDINAIATKAGYDNVSQYLADFLCAAHGYTQLVEGPTGTRRPQEKLPLSA